MNKKNKVIRDPIHRNIKIESNFIELLESPELQRLNNIKQLGFAYLVFPGAHHTRLEHSLGAYHIASKISESLDFDKGEKDIILSASLLHDIGHGPFSHTLESILLEKFGVDHLDLTEKILLGEYELLGFDEKRFIKTKGVHKILNNLNMDIVEIVNVIKGKKSNKSYLHQIMNSAIDVDQLDYLIRDAYYTGVSYGMIDIERLLQTIMIHGDLLAIKRKGVGVVENILMARGLMYSSVYFHKTVRIAELMLSKAIELIPRVVPFNFFKMTDAELISNLSKVGDYQKEIVTRLKYRDLFKQLYSASFQQLDKNDLDKLQNLENINIRRQKEMEIENALDIPHGHVIIDIPRTELLMAEPRLHKTDVLVIDRNEEKNLDDFTPVAEAIRSRITPDWVVMIISDEKYRDVIDKKAVDILFD